MCSRDTGCFQKHDSNIEGPRPAGLYASSRIGIALRILGNEIHVLVIDLDSYARSLLPVCREKEIFVPVVQVSLELDVMLSLQI